MFAYLLPVEAADAKNKYVNAIIACSNRLELQTINFSVGTVTVRQRVNVTDRILKVKYHDIIENSSLFSIVTVSWTGVMWYFSDTRTIELHKLRLAPTAVSSATLYLNAKNVFIVAQSQKLFITTPLSAGGAFDIIENVLEVKLTTDMGPLSSLLSGWESDMIVDLIATTTSAESAVLMVVKSKCSAVDRLPVIFNPIYFRRCESVSFRAVV